MRGIKTNTTPQEQQAHGKYAHAGSRTRVTSMGGLYDAATLHAPCRYGLHVKTNLFKDNETCRANFQRLSHAAAASH